MSKDQWIAEHERVLEEWESGELEVYEAYIELRHLGFDPGEIAQQLCLDYPVLEHFVQDAERGVTQ